MRATLLCDYTHTTILFIIILLFGFTTYATSPKIGSISKMHELLDAIAKTDPIAGNASGSLLTFRSKGGIIFGAINIVSSDYYTRYRLYLTDCSRPLSGW